MINTKKLKSRKFWLSCAVLLGSIATAIAGISTDNQYITLAGIICGAFSTAIYTICESVIDCENQEDVVESITENADGTTTVTYRKG